MALKQLITDVGNVKDNDGVEELLNKSPLDEFEKTLSKIKDSDWKDVNGLIEVCIEAANDDVMHYAEKILKKRKLIDWKKHPEIFENILQSLKINGARLLSEREEERFWRDSAYRDFCKNLLTLLKSLQMLRRFEEHYYGLALVGLRDGQNLLQDVVIEFTDNDVIDWKKHPTKCVEIFERFYEIVIANPELSEKDDVARNVTMSAEWILQAVRYATDPTCKKTAREMADVVSKLFHHCADAEWIDPDDMEERTMQHRMCGAILDDYLQMHAEDTLIVKPMFNKILELRDCEDEHISGNADDVFSMLRENMAELLGDRIDMVAVAFLENPNDDNKSALSEAYNGNSEAFKKYINQIICALIETENTTLIFSTLSLVWSFAKDYPEEFSKESIIMVAETLKLKGTHAFAMMTLCTLAPMHKETILPYDDLIIEVMRAKDRPGMNVTGANVLAFLAPLGEEHAIKYMTALVDVLKTCDELSKIAFAYQFKVIGQEYPKLLAEHRQFIEELMNDPSLKTHAEQMIDIIEGRTLESVTQEVAEQKGEMKELDTRVTDTEQKVDEVKEDIENLDTDVSQLKTEVTEQGEQITELDHKVEETNEKVDEIDKKTLSHAPVWSRDVARLLNPNAEYDWRFLATKLAYSNDDIRNWATQPDPCLSLLDEWFATHKTRDATFAVEQALNDMNRTDAAMIVENALKQTEDVVVDDEDEAWDPPPIFISYQWGHQQEVKMLHKHLETAGYKSWMDIGQMGGGDKLFAKIDQGIRAAKVIICCVSEKYAKSANCNREVNLATTLGKPMIPLLMEKMAWPPAGSMGPIFGEYIFVRLFARPGETAGDERYWPTAKFQELLMQLRLTHAPEQSLVKDPYTDWWSPPEEIIVIKPKEEKQGKSAGGSKEEANDEDESPDVFISYQWGKQPQIKKLFSLLTSKGYHCWLDIMQMGGGDSLYDKIDKGVRGCKVVVSCVTSKYALSANCRREVSLADALKKPIIPLLLEDITWPPAGPMSMPFTQLLYISFCKPNIDIQNHWNVPQMTELIGKLNIHVPRVGIADGVSITQEKPNDGITTQESAPKAASEVKPMDKTEKDTHNHKHSERQTSQHPTEQALKTEDKPKSKSSSTCTLI